MSTDGDGASRVAMPAGWQDWQRWVQDVDWSDWRGWLARVAATDWAAGPVPAVPWQQAPAAGEISLVLGAFAEDEPGEAIRDHLATTWQAFSRWWREGANARPTAAQARARLGAHARTRPGLALRRARNPSEDMIKKARSTSPRRKYASSCATSASRSMRSRRSRLADVTTRVGRRPRRPNVTASAPRMGRRRRRAARSRTPNRVPRRCSTGGRPG